jgi:broad specificity phosphatase PhoE
VKESTVPAARPRPGPARLVLVRHAESLGNVADRDARSRGDSRLDLHVRDADVALSPTGEQQAAAVGRYVATLPADEQPTVVLSSPYERAAATAAHALSAMDGRLRVRQDERLRERELGLFDGLTGAGIRNEFPHEADRRRYLGKFYYRPPSGESWCDVALRVRSLLRDMEDRYDGERVWVFSHQAVIMSFRLVLEGLGEREILDLDARSPMANCSMTSYLRGPDGALELESYADPTATQDSSTPTTREAVNAGQEADRAL